MAEFLPNNLSDKKFPSTPFHPKLMDLKLKPRPPATKLTDWQSLCLRKSAKALWISWQVRFDTLFAMCFISRASSNPDALFEECLDTVILYLYGTRAIGLTLGGVGGDSDLDACFGSLDGTLDGSSDFGVLARANCYTVERGPSTITAASRQDRTVSLSAAAGETSAVASLVSLLVAMRGLSAEMGCPSSRSSVVGCDNSASVSIAGDAASQKRDLYGLLKSEFIQSAQAADEISVAKIRTENNRSNILSKPIYSVTDFRRERDVLMNLKNQVKPS